jgi:hypothetical protein
LTRDHKKGVSFLQTKEKIKTLHTLKSMAVLKNRVKIIMIPDLKQSGTLK